MLFPKWNSLGRDDKERMEVWLAIMDAIAKCDAVRENADKDADTKDWREDQEGTYR